jgi:hypothetical protein
MRSRRSSSHSSSSYSRLIECRIPTVLLVPALQGMGLMLWLSVKAAPCLTRAVL